MDTLPVCQAKSKQTGKRSGNFAVRDRKVCHMHGGNTPKHNYGPKTEDGKQEAWNEVKGSYKRSSLSKSDD